MHLAQTPSWPAPATRIGEARALIAELCARGARIAVAPHTDVDGLAAGVLAIETIRRLGGEPLVALPGKGEHVHTPSMRARLRELRPDGLIVLDMGSRSGIIVEGLPTIVLDHHDAREAPDRALFVSAAGYEPVVPTGLLAYYVLSALTDLDDFAWLAVLAAYGDLGHPFASVLGPIAARYKMTHFKKAVALVNSARRAGSYQPDVALAALRAARGPADIAHGDSPEVARLASLRAEVAAEVTRVARVPPRIVGDVALIRFTSSAQIHPLIATRWMQRLHPKIVLVANDGYLPGRVNFAMRCAADIDLLAFLRGLDLGPVEGEFANGHPRATGGSIPPHEFERLLAALGFA
jgi:hypothetical protein